MTVIDPGLARRLVQGRPWHHDFDIVPGVRTHGEYDPAELWSELQLAQDLRGISLADVGASNGYFSFEAHKRGARVVAFDFRHRDNSGFGLAQYINGFTDIEHHHVNVLDIDAQTYGQFDVVLALGLLYHTADPYRALANCAALSRKSLFIESYCLDASLPSMLRAEPVMRFFSDPGRFPESGHVNHDRSNFWGLTSICLQRIVEDVGFAVHRIGVRADRVFIEAERQVSDARDTRLPLAYGVLPSVPAGDRDHPAAWTIF